MKSKRHLVIGITALISLLVIAGAAFAIHLGVSQFLIIRGLGNDGELQLLNPTANTMFAVVLEWGDSEDFRDCQGTELTPNDRDDFSTNTDSGLIQDRKSVV